MDQLAAAVDYHLDCAGYSELLIEEPNPKGISLGLSSADGIKHARWFSDPELHWRLRATRKGRILTERDVDSSS